MPSLSADALPVLDQGFIGDWRLADAEFLASFRLPVAADRIDVLAEHHPLPGERDVSFDEAQHRYSVRGLLVERSVTQLVGKYHAEFRPQWVAEGMVASPWWLERRAAMEEEIGGPAPDTAADLVRIWEFRSKVQRSRGQLLHFQVDQLLQGRPISEPWSPELQQAAAVCAFLCTRLRLRPFRTEVVLYSAEWAMAGTADALFIDADGDGCLTVVDWKRTSGRGSGFFESRFRSLKPPLQHLSDSKFWAYTLQLNMYRDMLERSYGFRVRDLLLALVHPDLGPAGRLVRAPFLRAEVELLRAEEALQPHPERIMADGV